MWNESTHPTERPRRNQADEYEVEIIDGVSSEYAPSEGGNIDENSRAGGLSWGTASFRRHFKPVDPDGKALDRPSHVLARGTTTIDQLKYSILAKQPPGRYHDVEPSKLRLFPNMRSFHDKRTEITRTAAIAHYGIQPQEPLIVELPVKVPRWIQIVNGDGRNLAPVDQVQLSNTDDIYDLKQLGLRKVITQNLLGYASPFAVGGYIDRESFTNKSPDPYREGRPIEHAGLEKSNPMIIVVPTFDPVERWYQIVNAAGEPLADAGHVPQLDTETFVELKMSVLPRITREMVGNASPFAITAYKDREMFQSVPREWSREVQPIGRAGLDKSNPVLIVIPRDPTVKQDRWL